MVADLISTDAEYYGKLSEANLEPSDDDDDDDDDATDNDIDDNCNDPPQKKVKTSTPPLPLWRSPHQSMRRKLRPLSAV
jgi:hypothetical protein